MTDLFEQYPLLQNGIASAALLLCFALSTYFVSSWLYSIRLIFNKTGRLNKIFAATESAISCIPPFFWTALFLWLTIAVLRFYDPALGDPYAYPKPQWLLGIGALVFALPLGIYFSKQIRLLPPARLREQNWSFFRSSIHLLPIFLSYAFSLLCIAEVAFRIPGIGALFVEHCRHSQQPEAAPNNLVLAVLSITLLLTIVGGILSKSLLVVPQASQREKDSEKEAASTEQKALTQGADPLHILYSYLGLCLILFFPLLLSFLPLLSELSLPMPEYPVPGTTGEELSNAAYSTMLRIAPPCLIAFLLCSLLIFYKFIISKDPSSQKNTTKFFSELSQKGRLHISWLILLLAAHAWQSWLGSSAVLTVFSLLFLTSRQPYFSEKSQQLKTWRTEILSLLAQTAKLFALLLCLDSTLCFLIYRKSHFLSSEQVYSWTGQGGLGELAARLEGTVFHLPLMGLAPAFLVVILGLAFSLWSHYLNSKFLSSEIQ